MKELKIEDYSKIKKYLDLGNYEGYNSNFVTMMMWNHEYHIQYEIHENFMVMLHDYKGEMFWAMPFTDELHYQEAIDYMLQYSQTHNFEFMIDCAIEEFVHKIENIYKSDLLFIRTPDNDDYIYDRTMLETLAGKKMQKRRNHYNSFIKEYPNYEYRDLDLVSDFETILNCLTHWEHEKENISESMTSEIRGIMYLLSSQHLLDFKVGGIFIDGQMEAFIIASLLKHSTIQIHVEKANKEIRGLYPTILKELLEHHFPGVKYVNREEDMGLENLRKSKQSLHPIKMIKKYEIRIKEVTIEQAKDKDKNAVMDLWRECFKDETEQSTAYYFNNLYKNDNTFILGNKNDIISVLQIVPFSIMKNKQNNESYFILGVCTKTNYQNNGLMKLLLDFVLKKYQNKEIYLQAYIPEIYQRFGFNASHYHQIIDIDINHIPDTANLDISFDYSLLESYYNDFCKHFDEYRIRNTDYWNRFLKRCIAFNEEIVIYDGVGYLVYSEDATHVFISELIYLNEIDIPKMLSQFKGKNKSISIECDIKVKLPGVSKRIVTMMSNQVNNDTIDPNKYINEIY